jgi:hypothetical protein
MLCSTCLRTTELIDGLSHCCGVIPLLRTEEYHKYFYIRYMETDSFYCECYNLRSEADTCRQNLQKTWVRVHQSRDEDLEMSFVNGKINVKLNKDYLLPLSDFQVETDGQFWFVKSFDRFYPIKFRDRATAHNVRIQLLEFTREGTKLDHIVSDRSETKVAL